ncbi:Soluble quinoprotein glucose/sorbosone dehydrogenase [Gracilaria domingensis]|nr:Soluble quinoprotein glucose/sorbosone dehydrogenase [Gracilaria domingensis]
MIPRSRLLFAVGAVFIIAVAVTLTAVLVSRDATQQPQLVSSSTQTASASTSQSQPATSDANPVTALNDIPSTFSQPLPSPTSDVVDISFSPSPEAAKALSPIDAISLLPSLWPVVLPDPVEPQSTDEAVALPDTTLAPGHASLGDDVDVPFDHVAHAVPGRPYNLTDLDGDGEEFVTLDGSRSHSHYYDPATRRLGLIVSWMWYDDQQKFLAESSTPSLSFKVGVTKIILIVEDDAGNTHQDSTTVTVLPSTSPGAYCYYYTSSSNTIFGLEDNVVNGLKPIFGQRVSDIDFSSLRHIPSQLRSQPLQIRCAYTLDVPEQTDEALLSVRHRGPMRVLLEIPNGHDVLMESFDTDIRTTSVQATIPSGIQRVQILYIWDGDKPPVLQLLETPHEPILHDLATQLPLVYSITPHNSTLEAGGVLKLTGVGLWSDPYVYFDDEPVAPDWMRSSNELLVVEVPSAEKAGTVQVTVGNRYGGSNAFPFVYADNALPPIRFKETVLKKDGDTFGISLITNIKFGPDQRVYLTSLDSFVHSMVVSKDMTVSDLCTSNSIGVNRTVIGLTFNPAEKDVIVYASSSIFFWSNIGTGGFLWANGQVSMLKPGYNGQCLGTVGDPIITGLPVSNHDHGVNGLLFDDNGMLHIQVGGATNAGASANTVGGIEESPLSGASLMAPVNQVGFDGHVKYDSEIPAEARQISGDVEIYAPGWRNSYELTLHSNGFMYATDNGANPEFGNRSTSCTESVQVSSYLSDDKLAKLLKGKFGGHANRNRGRDDPIQCIWRSPFDDATNNYNPPIATFESSTDGIIEYTANIFDRQLKGDLLASKFSSNDAIDNGRVYRVQLDKNGDAKEVDSLYEGSGLSIAMSPWGDLIMPKLYEGRIMVLKADYERRRDAEMIAVTPFRGGKNGGNTVLITGWGFDEDVTALFDGRPCLNVSERGPESFKCVVPEGEGGKSVAVTIVLGDGRRLRGKGYDYRYMRV